MEKIKQKTQQDSQILIESRKIQSKKIKIKCKTMVLKLYKLKIFLKE
jgi:hypothetical protein